MNKYLKLVGFGAAVIALSACKTTPPYKQMFEDLGATNAAYVRGENDAETYKNLKKFLDEAEASAEKNATKPQPLLASQLLAILAADSIMSVDSLSTADLGAAWNKAVEYASEARTSCRDNKSSGLSELDGAACALSVAFFHLNDTAGQAQQFETAYKATDWSKVKTISEAFETQVTSNWADIDEEVSGLAGATENAASFKDLALYRTCQFQRGQFADGTTDSLLKGGLVDGDKGQAQMAYLSAMKSAGDFLGDEILKPTELSLQSCGSTSSDVVCQAAFEALILQACER